VVFQAVASDAATAEKIRRETTGRRSRAEPASARPATEARRVARLARADGQPSEAPIRTSEDAQLVMQGEEFEDEVSSSRRREWDCCDGLHDTAHCA